MNFRETFLRGNCVFDGKLLKVYRDVIATPDGTEDVREIIRHPGAAVIVPQLNDGRFVLVRQFRYALDRETLEFPAGKLDPGEEPLNCAKRELLEETGYKAEDWDLLLKTHPLPGYSDELHWIYRACNLTPGGRDPDPDEWVSSEILSSDDLFECVQNGAITDGKTLISILYLARFP